MKKNIQGRAPEGRRRGRERRKKNPEVGWGGGWDGEKPRGGDEVGEKKTRSLANRYTHVMTWKSMSPRG